MQQRAVDDAGNIWEVDAQGNAVRLLQAAGAAPADSGVFSVPQDPVKAAREAAALEAANLSNEQRRRDLAKAGQPQGNLPAGYRWNAQGAAERIPGLPYDAGATRLTAAQRSAAISGYKSAEQLGGIIKDLEAKFAAGPGSTSGIAGLRDYLPTPTNRDFDNAGNAARGVVGQALGFTGGQLNTATEANMAVGPYLPQSDDSDQVIRSKIARLKELQANAQQRAIAQLGGVPDVNGNITPVDASGPSPTLPGPDLSLATGAQKFEPSDAASRLATEMLRAGMSDEQVNASLKAGGFTPITGESLKQVRTFLQQNPNFTGNVPGAGRVSDTSLVNRLEATPAGAAIGSYLDAASGGIPSLLAGQEGRDKLQQLNAEQPVASFIGGGLGSLTAGIGAGKALGMTRLAPWAALNPTKAALAGDAAYGAIYGANTADTGQGLTGAALGAGGGIFGNRVGAGLSRAAGRATRGVVDPAVNLLRQRGVQMTGGQMLGGMFKNAEDKLTSVPGVGNLIGDVRSEGMKNFGQAAFTEAGDVINYPVQRTGSAGVDDLLRATGRAYDNSTAGVSVPLDAQLTADVAAARAAAARLPGDLAQRAETAIANRVDPVIAGGTLSGPDYQQAFRGLKGYKAETSKPGFEQDYRDVLTGAQDALTGAMTRGGGQDVVTGLQTADRAYKMTKVLEDAVKRARNGARSGEVETFTPSQLTDAAVANRFSGNGTSRPFYDLSTAGQQVLPSSVPDSGTAGRMGLMGLAALGVPGVGAGIDYAVPGEGSGATATGLGTLATLAALNTKAGRKAMEKALLDRPDWVRKAGQGLIDKAPRFGLFGRGVGVSTAGLLSN